MHICYIGITCITNELMIKKTDPYISSVINATRVISGQLSKHEKGEVFSE